jgi:hypothetical protein
MYRDILYGDETYGAVTYGNVSSLYRFYHMYFFTLYEYDVLTFSPRGSSHIL